MAITKVTSGVIKDNSIDSDQYVDGSIDDVHLAIAKLSLSGGTMTGATVFGDQLSSRFTAKDYAETVYRVVFNNSACYFSYCHL